MDSSALEGGVVPIQRANADEFIHIFVNQSPKLTEFLEHMVKVSEHAQSIIFCIFNCDVIDGNCDVIQENDVNIAV